MNVVALSGSGLYNGYAGINSVSIREWLIKRAGGYHRKVYQEVTLRKDTWMLFHYLLQL